MATPRSQIRSRDAFTIIEMLIALTVLTVVLLLTSSGIVQALRTHQVQESTTSAQSKMRRVTEVLTQELRGAVLGGISDFPEVSDSDTVSFTLLTGTGGHIVTSSSGWGTDTTTTLYEPNPATLDALVGGPALVVNGNGEAVVVSNIGSVSTGTPSVSHPGCAMGIDHTRDTQLFGVRALSFDYDPDADTLFLREVANGAEFSVPFAFGITRFDVDYEYERTFNRQVLATNRLDVPHDIDGWPAAKYESGGETFELNRLRVTIGTESEDGVAERTYSGFVEMAGVGEFVGPSGEGNSFTSLTLCDTTGGGDPGDGGSGDDGDDGGDDGDDGDDGDGGDDDETRSEGGRMMPMRDQSTHRGRAAVGPRRRDGVAMIAALALMAVASAIMVLMFMRTMDDLRHGRDDVAIVQTLLAAQGGSNLAKAGIENDVKDELASIASSRSSTVEAWSFGSSAADEDAPTPTSVSSDLGQVANDLQDVVDDLFCDPIALEDGATVTVRVFVTETACSGASTSMSLADIETRLGEPRFLSGRRRNDGGNQRYALPYVIVSDGQLGEFQRRVVTHGEGRFLVGRKSFAQYALFTDEHSFGGAGRIWFTDRTLFDGPVHTNDNFNFYDSAWFGGPVTSAGDTVYGAGAWGYRDGFFDADDLTDQGQSPNLDYTTRNRPVFAESTPDWEAAYIDLPSNAYDQRTLAQDSGLYFDFDIDTLELYAGDDDANPVAAGEDATYQYIEVEPRFGSTELYRVSPDGELQRFNPGDFSVPWSTVNSDFNGVIYSEEYVDRLRGPGRTDGDDPDTAGPALASFSQLTLVPAVGARVTGDLTYEVPPCEGSLERLADGTVQRPTCDRMDARNVLGVFAPAGDIQIGNYNGTSSYNAPEDVKIHGSLMASNGVVTVEDYNRGSPRGQVELLGGIIEEEYGPFGTFSGSTGESSSGYGRKFTYDPRLADGLSPPYFPTLALDDVGAINTVTFGTREQVY